MECPVGRAIVDALRDSAEAYEARGILVITDLTPTSGLVTSDAIVHRAVYTCFRVLPARLARGASIRISTHARAGGDLELIWEAREDADVAAPSEGTTPRTALSRGPHGDLLEVAVTALEDICRARGGLVEQQHIEPPASSAILREPTVWRRYLFLIPSQERQPFAPPDAR